MLNRVRVHQKIFKLVLEHIFKNLQRKQREIVIQRERNTNVR